MAKSQTQYECQSCGYSATKWLGRCPDCGSWNSFVEEKRIQAASKSRRTARVSAQAFPLSEVPVETASRIQTHNGEFDRVLGGGIVPGSLILLGGEPGIGKSTLILQVAQALGEQGRRVLYVSGEESAQQIRLRADRLAFGSSSSRGDSPERQSSRVDAIKRNNQIFVLAESNLERILAAVEEVKPTELVIDSIQTTYSEDLDSAPGSISQVRHVAAQLLGIAKNFGIPVFLIGHITKDGTLAGPKTLEHIVDAVLYFEGERHHNHRIVRAVKNRFGASNEVGVFEMTSRGLVPVQNPSSLFLGNRETSAPGTAVVCALEGSRTLLVEIQALVSSSQYSTARRVATGLDYNRLSMLAAMLEKRLGFHLLGCDIYVNAAGGLEIDEPAVDLGIVAAILSSFRNRPLPGHTVLFGELGLSGEVRPISQAYARVREAASMGFKQCVLPSGNLPLVDPIAGVTLAPVRDVSLLGEILFGA